MPGADVVIEINYDINNPEKTVIRTNAKESALPELLETFLLAQRGKGKDERPPNLKDEYKITIRLDLSDDTFYTTSDTGNEALTCGIVLDVLERLDQMTI